MDFDGDQWTFTEQPGSPSGADIEKMIHDARLAIQKSHSMQNLSVPFTGANIVENDFLVVDGDPVDVVRTLKERWFSLPWRPFKKTKIVIPKVPSRDVIILDGKYIIHPAMANELRNMKSATIRANNF